MSERVPQFTLRNIPRVERDVELDRPMRFEVEERPLDAAQDALKEVREAELPRFEMPAFWSAELVNDFRIFLEEVLYLCPWDAMPKGRQPPPDDSLWSSKHSHASLTYELLHQRTRVIIFGAAGRAKTLRRSQAQDRSQRVAEVDAEKRGIFHKILDDGVEPMG